MMDWTDKAAVIALAKRLGRGQTVVWNGRNFNILHTSEEARLLRGRLVVFRTEG